MTTTIDIIEQVAEETRGTKLKGRVALVTGGTRGIGAAIGRSLANQGAVIASGYSRNREGAEGYRESLEHDGSRCSIHQGNVGSAEDCRRVVAEVVEQHGRLDILVNNAGITADKTVLKMEEQDWYTVLAVNLSGAFFMSQAALEHMLERGTGRIVNISSVIGEMGNIGQANYAASKSGLFGLTRTLAREAAFMLAKSGKLENNPVGVTINAVAPGATVTPRTVADPEWEAGWARATPLGRPATVADVASAALFLLSPEAAHITGQTLLVDGGWTSIGAEPGRP